MCAYQNRDYGSGQTQTFFNGMNGRSNTEGNTSNFFTNRGGTGYSNTNPATDRTSFFNRDRPITPSFNGSGQTVVGGTGGFFNRNEGGYNTNTLNAQANTGFDSSSSTPGTMHIPFKETPNPHRECHGNYTHCITSMRDYEVERSSLFKRRCEDYMKISTGNMPNNIDILSGIRNYTEHTHMNPQFIDKAVFDAVKMAPPVNHGNRLNQPFQTANNLYRQNNNTNTNTTIGGNNPFFNRGATGNTGSTGNNFFQGQNNQPQGNQWNSNSNTGGSFFGNRSQGQANTTGQQGNTGGSFFGSKNQSGNGGGNFFQSQNSTNQQGQNQTGGGFFQSGNTNKGNFFGQNQNSQQGQGQDQGQTGGSFFQSGTNQSTNGFFQNRNQQSGSFIGNQGNQQQQQGNNFFKTGQNNTSGNFFQSQTGSNQFSRAQNQPGNFFAQQQGGMNGQPDGNYFGQQFPNNFQGFGMMPPYGPYPPGMMSYAPFIPYPQGMVYPPLPISYSQDAIKSARLNPLIPFIDPVEIEKNIERERAEELKKQVEEIERRHYVLERYLDTMNKEKDDYYNDMPTGTVKLPVIMSRTKGQKNSVNNSMFRSKANWSMSSKTQQQSFLTARSTLGSSRNQLLINTTATDISKDLENRFVNLRIEMIIRESKIFFENYKICIRKTIQDLKKYLLNKVAKNKDIAEELLDLTTVYIDNENQADQIRLKDIPHIDEKKIVVSIEIDPTNEYLQDSFTSKLRYSPVKQKKHNLSHYDNETEHDVSIKNLCNPEDLPIFTKPGYTMKPSITQMSRMTREQLMSIEDLTISNEFGEIKWPGKTDVLRVNFDFAVHIRQGNIEVYPDDIYTELTKPERGSKLNKVADICLRNVHIKASKTKNIDEKLEEMCEKQEAKLISYDSEQSLFKFRVFHFTKYAFSDIEDEEELVEEAEPRITSRVNLSRSRNLDDQNGEIREDKSSQPSNQNILENLLMESSRQPISKPPKNLRSSKDFTDQKQIAPVLKKLNVGASPYPNLRDSNDGKFILENNEINLEKEYQDQQTKLKDLEKMSAFQRDRVKQQINKNNEDFNKYKIQYSNLPKEFKPKNRQQTDKNLIDKIVTINRINTGDVLRGQPEFCNDFAFGLDWTSNSNPYFVDGSNHFRRPNNSLETFFKIDQNFLSVLSDTLTSKKFNGLIGKAIANVSTEADLYYEFLVALYFEMQQNRDIFISSENWCEMTYFIRLILELFLLADLDINEPNSHEKILHRVKQQREERALLAQEENDLFNHRMRRRLFNWIEQFIKEKANLPNRTNSFIKVPEYKSSNLVLNHRSFDLAKFKHDSENVIKNNEGQVEDSGYIWAFYQLMQRDDSASKPIEQLIKSFSHTIRESEIKPLDIIFVNVLRTYANVHSSPNNNNEGFELVNPLKDLTNRTNEFSTLNVFVLMAMQSNIKFKNFDDVFGFTYRHVQEVALQQHEFFIALALNAFMSPLVSSENSENEAHKIAMLHFISNNQTSKGRTNYILIKEHFRKSKIMDLKIFKYLIENKVKKIIEVAGSIGMSQISYDILLRQINGPILERCLTDETELTLLLDLFDVAERQALVSSCRISSIIHAYLLMVNAFRNDYLTFDLVDDYCKKIFEGVRFMKVNDLVSAYRGILEVVCQSVLMILADPNYDFVDYLKKTFIPKFMQEQYAIVIPDDNKSLLIGKLMDRLK